MNKDLKKYTKKVASDYNVLTRIYQYYAMYVVFPLVTTWFYKFKFLGRENIDKSANYIVAPNHISYFDVFMTGIIIQKPVAFMAKKELFESNWWIAKNIYRLGAFSINREKPEKATFKTVKEILKTKYDLCIFPQGGIRKNKLIEDINGGFIYFAKMGKRDILPIGIKGVEQYNWNPFKRQNVEMIVGKPISYELSEEEIMKNWKEQISSLTGYEIK